MKARLTILLALAVIAAAVVSGCGDGDDDTGSAATGTAAEAGSESGSGEGSDSQGDGGGEPVTTSSLSKSAFIKQASAACEKERKDLVTEASEYLDTPPAKNQSAPIAFAGMARVVMAPTIEAEIAAVRELGAPAGDEEEIEAMLAAQEAGVEEIEGLQKAKSLEEIESHFDEATELYEAYGFESCTNS